MSGTTVDSSIARGVAAPPAPMQNPLDQFGRVVGIANALNTNRRENETFGAQQQIGRALQGSMNPQTGQVDHDAFARAIQGNPLAAFLAPQALIQARQLEQGVTQVQAAQAQLGMMRLNNLRTTVGGLLASPNTTRADVVNAVSQLVALPESERPFSATVAATALASLPQNPEQIRPWLMTQLASTETGLAHLQRFLPEGGTTNVGGQVRATNRDPVTGQVTQAGGNAGTMTMTPTPRERDEPTTFYDPTTRSMRTAPRQDVLPMYDGDGRPIPGTGQGGAPSPFGTGRYPGGASGAPGATPTPPFASQGQRPPGPIQSVPSGPALGEPQAVAAEATQAAESASALARQAAELPNLRTILANLDTLVRGFSPGPGTQWQRVAAAGWNRLAPNTLQFNPQSIASQEEFVKQAFSLASQQFAALGGTGSNEQLAQVLGTSPSELLSRQGNQGIIAMLRGNADAMDVANREWQRHLAEGGSPSQFNQFMAEFNRGFNPRVFQWMYLSREARETMWRNMSPQDRANLTRSAGEAVQRGWVQFPEGQNRGATR